MSFIDNHTRLLTGLVLAVVFFSIMYLGGVFVQGFVLVVSTVALWEYYQLFWPQKEHLVLKCIGLLFGALFVLTYNVAPVWPMLFAGLSLCAAGLAFLFDYGTGNHYAKVTDYTPIFIGIAYIPLILCLALTLTWAEQLFVVFAAIVTDTGAYYVGSAFGTHKIWPSVSPKKSWEGACGGFVFCLILCFVTGQANAAFNLGMPVFPWWGWVIMGFFLNASAQLGDFFESALKRSLQVKDTSALLPGHGGILDRIDSVLFVVPTYTLIRTFFHEFPALLTGSPL